MSICHFLGSIPTVSKHSPTIPSITDMKSHHHLTEEERLFPDIERITGEKGIMERNLEQHHAFLPGLDAFGKYAKECLSKEKSFDAKHFVDLMDGFGPALATHLKEEIDTLRSLGKYDVQAIKQAYMGIAAEAAKQSKVSSRHKV